MMDKGVSSDKNRREENRKKRRKREKREGAGMEDKR
jgi:hypothetical protein